MQGIQQAKRPYLQSEADERLAAAMKRKADPYQPPISFGIDVMFYRDGKKSFKGWHGPDKVKDRKRSDYTIKHGR